MLIVHTPARHLTCAYEYGVPAASSNNYHSDGSYSGDVWKVEGAGAELGVAMTFFSTLGVF